MRRAHVPRRLADLLRLCEQRGWRWVDTHLRGFVPADLEDPESFKPISELALTYMVVAERRPPRVAPLPAVLRLLTDVLGDPAVAERGRKSPALFYPYLMSYLPLRAAGLSFEAFEDALARVRRSGYPHALELYPYRALELSYILWKAFGGTRPAGALRADVARTALGRCRTPVYLTEDDVYSVTHTVFYLTDFGATAASSSTWPARRRHVSILEALLVDACRRGNWDLAGELLIGIVALDAAETTLFCVCASALAEAWRPDGLLPGPRAPSRRSHDRFRAQYHTILVGLLLCAVYLRRA